MHWIHENNNWTACTWDASQLSKQLCEVKFKQGILMGLSANFTESSEFTATVENLVMSITSSSAIEGEFLREDEVRSSVEAKMRQETDTTLDVGRHIAGMTELTMDATTNYNDPLTKERLCSWHGLLFPTGMSGMHKIKVGGWRLGPMSVVSGLIGKHKIHFVAPGPERLEKEMSCFLDWLNNSNGTDLVIKSAIAHFWFVTIHPFEDGNGRTARAISDMLLARSEGTSRQCYNMSSQILFERKHYYAALQIQSRDDSDITEWLSWFLGCLGRSIEEGLMLARVEKIVPHPRQMKVLRKMMSLGFEGYMQTAKYVKIAKCSRHTAIRDLHKLAACRVLVVNPGAGRNISYRLNRERLVSS